MLFSRPSVENLKTLQIPLQFCSIHNTHRDNFAYRSYMYLVCLIKLCSVYVIFEADFGNFEKTLQIPLQLCSIHNRNRNNFA